MHCTGIYGVVMKFDRVDVIMSHKTLGLIMFGVFVTVVILLAAL